MRFWQGLVFQVKFPCISNATPHGLARVVGKLRPRFYMVVVSAHSATPRASRVQSPDVRARREVLPGFSLRQLIHGLGKVVWDLVLVEGMSFGVGLPKFASTSCLLKLHPPEPIDHISQDPAFDKSSYYIG